MSGRKPFKAVPLRYVAGHRRRAKGAAPRSAGQLLTAAIIAGITVGAGSLAFSGSGRADLTNTANKVSAATGIARARAPQAGDHWSRCDEARAAGTAPIYEGEPGYREGLDGDSDGIACEPYRGQ